MITLELYIDKGEGWELQYTLTTFREQLAEDSQYLYDLHRFSIGNRPWMVCRVPKSKKQPAELRVKDAA